MKVDYNGVDEIITPNGKEREFSNIIKIVESLKVSHKKVSNLCTFKNAYEYFYL